MKRGFVSWTNPFQSADADRDQQRREASQAFHELVTYYHSNSVWLDQRTCEKIEAFMETAWITAWEYADNLNEQGHPQSKEGREASLRLARELPSLRRQLEDEFRAILYPPHWSKAPLRFLGRNQPRNRKPDHEPVRRPPACDEHS